MQGLWGRVKWPQGLQPPMSTSHLGNLVFPGLVALCYIPLGILASNMGLLYAQCGIQPDQSACG